MANTMKGVIVEGVGAPYKVVDNLEVPQPGEHQVLVKSIATAINPVDTYMSATGMLINSFPIVLGCDSSGIVVKTGPKATLKEGQRVCGCTRLGHAGYSTFQEYFLVDDRFPTLPPSSLSFNEAATIGVGTETACINLLQGIKLPLPDDPASPLKTGEQEWVVVLGGAGSVGQYSVQIAKALGFKVVATCSKRTAETVKNLGADATVDYSLDEAKQIEEIKAVTGGNFFGVSDTVAKSEAMGRKLLDEVSVSKKRKCYATTDDWSPMEPSSNHELHRAKLGYKGRPAADSGQDDLDDALVSFGKLITQLLEQGKIKPNEFTVAGKGFDAIPKAVELQQSGAGGKKVVVELASA